MRNNSSQLRVTSKGELSPKSTKRSQTDFVKKLEVPPESIFASYFPMLPIIYKAGQVTKSVVKPEVEELQYYVGF